jgi:hypothetical protein
VNHNRRNQSSRGSNVRARNTRGRR